VVPRDDEERRSEGTQEVGGALVLLGRVAMRQVAACDHELGLEVGDERPQVVLHFGLLTRARMKVGNLQDAYGRHRAGTL
jgi:hypothetical protein